MRSIKKVTVVLAMCLLLTGCTGKSASNSEAAKLEGEGFESAEDAVNFFMEGLKELDIEKMLKAYAWETQAEHYKFETLVERYDAYVPTMTVRLPSDDEFYNSANASIMRSNESRYIYNAIVNYVLSDDIDDLTKTVPLIDEDKQKEFLKIYSNDKYKDFQKISNVRFIDPDKVTGGQYSSDKNAESVKIVTDQYGADTVKCMAVLADVEDKTLYFFPAVARYGDKWYIVSGFSPISTLIGVPVSTGAFFITSEDVNQLFR